MVPPPSDPDGAPPPSPDATDSAAPAFVRKQIRQIERGLTKVLFGDYTAVISLEDADPLWGNLAMHVNVAINAVRNAIHRAEASEREAAMARDRALAAAAAESTFLTNVTHELRTPLASIRAAAEILRDFCAQDPAAAREFIDIMVSESERLSRLIENVLDLGKLQSANAPWQLRPVDLPEIVRDMVASMWPLSLSKGVHIECTVDPDAPQVIGDADALKQVGVNLVSNALKFSRSGDRVTVTLRQREDEGLVVLEVGDQGEGIPPDQIDVIFERFRQVTSNILTAKPAGTGLGLAIVKEIVDRHGGRIEVDSALGVGSTFRVLLPAAGADRAEALTQRTNAAPPR